MLCKTCHYSLTGLAEHRCPECGTAFDPADPKTYRSPVRFFTHWMSLVVLAFIPLFWLVARSAFYRPDYSDHNSGAGLMASFSACFVTILLAPVVMLIVVVVRLLVLRR